MSNNKSRISKTPEKMVRLYDPKAGLDGYIVIHSTKLGQAAGGCRLWSYKSEALAAADAMRLARGMALKNALAGLPLGGGKAVLRLPEGDFDRGALFEAFGRAVNKLEGEYITAEDVGTNVSDMEAVREETQYVAGLQQGNIMPGGDPSPWTARGVFESMKVAVRTRLGADLSEVTVAVQGLGHVGFVLSELLHEAGAQLIVAEPKSALAARAAVLFGAEVADGRTKAGKSGIGLASADVFAPCALGGAVTQQLAKEMKATVICGAANNQLAEPSVADILADRNVLYAPDYLVNAGGIINVAAEYFGWRQPEVEMRIAAIAPRLDRVLDAARNSGDTTDRAAERQAMANINGGRIERARVA